MAEEGIDCGGIVIVANETLGIVREEDGTELGKDSNWGI